MAERDAEMCSRGRVAGRVLRPASWAAAVKFSRYRREALTSSVMSIAGFSIGLVTGPVLARAVGPVGRGEIAAVVQPAWLLGWLLCFGMPLAAAYWLDGLAEGRLLGTTTAFGLVCGGIVCLPLWFVAPVYLSGYSSATVVWARMFLLILPLSAGVNTALEIRRRRGADMAWNRWRIAPPVISAVGIVFLALAGILTTASALACYFVGGLVPIVFFVLRMYRVAAPWPSMATLRHLLPYAWRTAALTGANSVTGRLDQVVLATAVPSGQLGIYAVAVTTASMTNALTIGLPLALFGHHRSDIQRTHSAERYRRSLVVTVAVSSGAALVLGISAPMILRLAFGMAFESATLPLRILLPGSVAFDLLGLISSKLSAEGRVGVVAQAAVVGASVTVVGLLVIVPSHGIRGAAAVTSMSFGSQVAYLLLRDRRNELTMHKIAGDDQ